MRAKESTLDKLDADNANAQKNNQKLDAQLKDVHDDLDAHRDANSKRNKETAGRDADLRSVQTKVKEAEAAVAALTAESKKLLGDVKNAEHSADETSKGLSDQERRLKGLQAQLADVRADLEAEEDDRNKAEKAQKAAQALVLDAQNELKELEAEKATLDTRLKAKTAEAAELAGKAASDSIAKEQVTWKAEKKKAQDEVDAVRTKLDAAEGAKNRNQRKLKKLQAELADLKAANSNAEKSRSTSKGSGISEDDARRLDKELKANQSSVTEDERELKNLQSELELLRDLFRKAVTTTGESVILGLDGRAAKTGGGASRSASGNVDSPAMSRTGSASRFK